MKPYRYYFRLTEAMSKTDALEIFGIEGFADQNELNKLYKDLSRKNHPDLGGDVEKMKNINQAYDVLKSLRGGASKPETWEDRHAREKELNKKYIEIWNRIKSLFEKSFDEKTVIDYLQQFTSDPLSVTISDNKANTGNIAWFRGRFEASVKIHNADNTTVFYVEYSISPVENDSKGLGFDNLDDRDISYDVSIRTDVYHNKRKHKINQQNYSWKIGFKAVDDLKNVFPSAKLKKIFNPNAKKKAFKKADMFKAMQRELPGSISFGSGGDFWIKPFDGVEMFQIACGRYTMPKILSATARYSIGSIFYPVKGGGRVYLAYTLYETEEDLEKLITFIKTSYETVKKKKLDPETNGKEVAQIFENIGNKIFNDQR